MVQKSSTVLLTKFSRSRLSFALLAAGLVMVALGIWGGETARILEKATQVCLQCIGIG